MCEMHSAKRQNVQLSAADEKSKKKTEENNYHDLHHQISNHNSCSGWLKTFLHNNKAWNPKLCALSNVSVHENLFTHFNFDPNANVRFFLIFACRE